jgi:hypothetical protein
MEGRADEVPVLEVEDKVLDVSVISQSVFSLPDIYADLHSCIRPGTRRGDQQSIRRSQEAMGEVEGARFIP